HESMLNHKLCHCYRRLLVVSFRDMHLEPLHQCVPIRSKGGDGVGERGNIVLKERHRSPGEQARGDDLHLSVNEQREGLVLKPNDDCHGKRARPGCCPQEVRTAEIEYELHTTIRGDVLLGLRRKVSLMDPEALDGLLEDDVRSVLVIFHGKLPTTRGDRKAIAFPSSAEQQ